MTTEEQAAEDERAREAALRSIASMGDVESQAASALGLESTPNAPPSGPDPFARQGRASPGMRSGSYLAAAGQAYDAARARTPGDLHGTAYIPPPEENTDLTSGVAGVDGIHDYDFEALPREEVTVPRTLARDDMEPLGGVSRGQMFAPSGAPESAEGRFARLGVGGGFSGSAIAPVTADDALGRRAPVSPASAIPSTVDTPDPATLAAKPDRDPAREAAAGPLPTLYDGLPSEEQIGQQHTRDDWGHVLHNIGAAFSLIGSALLLYSIYKITLQTSTKP